MSKRDDFKYVLVPDAVNIINQQYSHEELVCFWIDASPAFRGAAKARIGRKILDAIVEAREANLHYYRLTLEQWKVLHAVAEDENTPFPVWHQQMQGQNGPFATVLPIGVARYLPLIECITAATTDVPSSEASETAEESA